MQYSSSSKTHAITSHKLSSFRVSGMISLLLSGLDPSQTVVGTTITSLSVSLDCQSSPAVTGLQWFIGIRAGQSYCLPSLEGKMLSGHFQFIALNIICKICSVFRNKDLPSPSWEQQRATAIVILAKEISFIPQTSNSKRGFSSLMLMVLLESQMSTSRGSNITQVLQLKIVFSHFLLCLLIYLLTYLLFFSHKLHSNSILSSLHSTPPDLFLFRFTLEKEPTSQDIHHTQHNKLQ